ncbi:MAG: NAD(P)H-dependent oxidoreductase [Deltaproteobacteria bacterium]|nr:NAD(P)H-dependent oxidoreductase [Deltaproteobacteria bacterium]
MANDLAFVIGTSRADGNTRRVLDHVNLQFKAPIFDLAALDISCFDYEARNLTDDFIPTIESLQAFSTIGFVSPMYWYTVSAQMKTFIDRLSDLLGPRKDLGRKLRGKNTFLLATGNTEKQITPGMEEVIKRTSDYMGMSYRGAYYAHIKVDLAPDSGTLRDATEFVRRVLPT